MNKILLFIGLSIFSSNLFSQQRVDDKLPIISSPISSLLTLTGWTKNSIGKWSSLPNGIPQFEYDLKSIMPYCERVIKMEMAKIEINEKQYWIVGKFTKHIYGQRMEKLEYAANYWVFELPFSKETATDTTVTTLTYKTFISGIAIGFLRPVVWSDISKLIKEELSNRTNQSEDRFFIQYRNDKKNKRMQFMIGTYNHDLESYGYDLLCSGEEKNIELSNMYYEITDEAFKRIFLKIAQ